MADAPSPGARAHHEEEGGSSEATPGSRPRGRPRDAQADERILRAVTELLATSGFERMTVDDVAERAGVGKATVYRRWKSKQDLAVAAVENLYAMELPERDTGDLEADLTEMYRAFLAFLGSGSGAALLRMFIAESIRDPRIAELYRTASEQREVQAKRTLERAIDRGELRPDADLDAAVQWLGGLLTLRVVTGRPLPSPEEAPQLVRLLLDGLRGRR